MSGIDLDAIAKRAALASSSKGWARQLAVDLAADVEALLAALRACEVECHRKNCVTLFEDKEALLERVRELEAEANGYAQDLKHGEEIYNGNIQALSRRAEAAEARCRELEAALDELTDRSVAERNFKRAEAAEARCRELEAARKVCEAAADIPEVLVHIYRNEDGEQRWQGEIPFRLQLGRALEAWRKVKSPG